MSSKATVNSLCYQRNILESIFETEIAASHGKDIIKIEFSYQQNLLISIFLLQKS